MALAHRRPYGLYRFFLGALIFLRRLRAIDLKKGNGCSGLHEVTIA
jgi:hypothetical protein